MTRLLRVLTVSLFAVGAFATTQPATAAGSCSNLVTCYGYLPEHQTASSLWTYSHQCCDLEDGTTIWNVYIDPRGKWHLVSSGIEP